jgi:hydroxyacylglutathione hydrolase
MGQLQAIIVPVTPFQQNCTILFDGDTKKGVVIDPGGDFDRIKEAIASQNVDVEAIWITHGHIDHAGAALDLKEDLGVEIIGPHKDDKFLLDNLATTGLKYGLTEGVRNVTPDRWLEEGDTVSVAGHTSMSSIAQGMHRDMWCSIILRRASRLLETFCSTVQSVVLTCRAVITPHSFAR